MIKLSKKNIEDLCYPSTFKKGEEYFIKNKVSDLNIEQFKDEYGVETHRISSTVTGSSSEVYDCMAIFKKHQGLSGVFCTCEAFHNYEGICKHLVATLLKYIQDNNNFSSKLKDLEINDLINSLKFEMEQTNSYKKELSMDVNVIMQSTYRSRDFFIELKVGENKKYVVKNIRNFIGSVKNFDSLEFGKGFTYNPSVHTFSPIDKSILGLLSEVYETQIHLENNMDYYSNYVKLLKGKSASLNEPQFIRLLKILEKRPFELKLNDEIYKDIEIRHENLPLKFEISGDEENIRLYQNNPIYTPLTSDGQYFLCNNNIYKPDIKQINYYNPLFNKFLKKNEITIPKSKWGDFSKFIIPTIKEITSEIKINDKIKNHIVKEPLESSIYFDKVDDYITAYIEFKYGESTINPIISENKEDVILIRDTVKEIELLSILKNYGFKESKTLLTLEDEKNIVEFLYEGIGKLQNISNLFYSDAFKNIRVHSSSSIKSSLKINENDFLEISFSMDDIDNSELSDIFNSIRTKKSYHKLKNGSFVLLNSLGLTDFTDTLDYLGIKNSDLSKDSIFLNKYNALYLDEKFKNNEIIEVEKNSRFRETISSIKEVKESDFKAPNHLQKILRDYQKIGFKWLKTLAHYGFGGILADEMGLGKTLQAIAFMCAREKDEMHKPVLVICPTSLMYNWENEIQKFAPELKVQVICGNKDSRFEKIKNINNTDVIITSYPLIRIDIEEYKNINFSYCFLDEAQAIKNPNAQSSRAVREIKAKGRFALTGTPIENSLTELWSIFDFIMPGYLLNHTKFKTLYENPVVKDGNKKALEELNKHIKPFILRRCKKDVVKELPEKIEHTVIVDLCDEQKKLYASHVNSFKAELEQELNQNGLNKSKIKILALLTRLRQLCCDPSIFIENYRGESSKVSALLDILDNILQEGHRVLIFSQFTSMLKNISKELKDKKIKYLYLDGSVKSEERMNMVNDFNEGNSNVFLISLKAGGTGLNLTGADTVIHFDPWWNPAVENQASDRAHRIGQKKTVEVIKLIAKGTIEEKINKLQEKKKDIFNMTIENASDVNVLSKMNEEEIKQLFDI